MNPIQTQYEDYLRHIYVDGVTKADRTGTGTRSVFGYQMRFDLSKGFPLVTTKKVHTKSILVELLWFLRGETNIKYLTDNGCSIWDEWATKEDKVVETEYDNYERVKLLAEKLGIEAKAATAMLQDADAEVRRAGVIPSTEIVWQQKPEEYNGAMAILRDNGIPTKYNKVVVPKGELGPVYGKQWRSWEGADGKAIDQITEVIETLKKNPDSRRIMVSAWNVADLDKMALMPCHALFQFYSTELDENARVELLRVGINNSVYPLNEVGVSLLEHLNDPEIDAMVPKRRLSCQLYQRSCDSFLGVPFNIASYAFLTEMIAQQVNMVAGDFIWTGGDCHIYSNHYEQVKEQIQRIPFAFPTLKFKRKPESIFDYQLDDFEIVGYEHHAAIKGAVSV